MALRKQVFISRLNGGEITSDLTSRIDLEKYQGSLTDCENWVPQLQGGLKRRRATRYIGKINTEEFGVHARWDLPSEIATATTLTNTTEIYDETPPLDSRYLDPRGTYMAYELRETTDGSPQYHYMSADLSNLPKAVTARISFYVRKAPSPWDSRNWFEFKITNWDNSSPYVYFNIDPTANGAGYRGTQSGGSLVDWGIEQRGDNWFYVWIDVNTGTSSTSPILYWYLASADDTVQYQGDGTGGIQLFDIKISTKGSSTEVRLIPYSPNDFDQYLLEITDKKVRIWKDDNVVTKASGWADIGIWFTWGAPAQLGSYPTSGFTYNSNNYPIVRVEYTPSGTPNFYLEFTPSAEANYLQFPTYGNTRDNKYYRIVMRVRCPAGGQATSAPFGAAVFMKTGVGGTEVLEYLGYIGADKHTARVGEWQEYIFVWRCTSDAQGQNTAIRIEPAYVAGGSFHIDRVVLEECYPVVLEAPWVGEDLKDIQFAQYGYSLYLTHPDYPPQRIVSYDYENWTITDLLGEVAGQAALRPPPTFEDIFTFNSALTLSATTGTGVTATAANALFRVSDVDRMIVYRDSKAVITNVASDDNTVATISIVNDFPRMVIPANEWGMQGSPQGTITIASGEGGPPNSIQTWDLATNNLLRAASGWYSGDVGKYLRVLTDPNGIARILSFDSTTVTVQIIRTVGEASSTPLWRLEESAWSVNNGYPAAVAFHEQRLWFGGTARQPQTLWGSTIASFEDFYIGPNADDSVAFTLVSEQTAQIRWLASQRNMVAGTPLSEFRIEGSPDTGITATTPPIIRQETAYGTNNVQPIRAGDSMIFWDASGTKMIEYKYNYEGDSYQGKQLNILTKDYWQTNRPVNRSQTLRHAYLRCDDVDIVWSIVGQRSVTAHPYMPYLFGMAYNKEHEMASWFHTHLSPQDICVIRGGTSWSGLYTDVDIVGPYNRNDDLYIAEDGFLLRLDNSDLGFIDYAIRYVGWPLTGFKFPPDWWGGFPSGYLVGRQYTSHSNLQTSYDVSVTDDFIYLTNGVVDTTTAEWSGLDKQDFFIGMYEYDSDFVIVPVEIQSEDGGTTMDRNKRIAEILVRADGENRCTFLANGEAMVLRPGNIGQETGMYIKIYRAGDQSSDMSYIAQVDMEVHDYLYGYIMSMSVALNFGEGP